VLLSSTGVSVHRLYCYCKGEVTASIFRPDDPCELMVSSEEKEGCCKNFKCGPPSKSERHDCADCISEYVKLDVKYLVFAADYQLTAPAAILPAFAFPDAFSFVKTTKITSDQDHPPPYGKDLLPWIQSFLC